MACGAMAHHCTKSGIAPRLFLVVIALHAGTTACYGDSAAGLQRETEHGTVNGTLSPHGPAVQAVPWPVVF